jgi:hypothetical protein
MNKTTNYGLGKPLGSEKYSVTVVNNNSDIIDKQMKANADAAAAAQTTAKTAQTAATAAQTAAETAQTTADSAKTTANSVGSSLGQQISQTNSSLINLTTRVTENEDTLDGHLNGYDVQVALPTNSVNYDDILNVGDELFSVKFIPNAGKAQLAFDSQIAYVKVVITYLDKTSEISLGGETSIKGNYSFLSDGKSEMTISVVADEGYIVVYEGSFVPSEVFEIRLTTDALTNVVCTTNEVYNSDTPHSETDLYVVQKSTKLTDQNGQVSETDKKARLYYGSLPITNDEYDTQIDVLSSRVGSYIRADLPDENVEPSEGGEVFLFDFTNVPVGVNKLVLSFGYDAKAVYSLYIRLGTETIEIPYVYRGTTEIPITVSDNESVVTVGLYALKEQTINPSKAFKLYLKTGMSFLTTTKEVFDTMESHDPTTVYYVLDGNKVTQYLGDTKLSSGSSVNGVAVTLADSPAVQAEQGIEGFAECVTTEFSGSDFESVDNDDGVSGLTVRLTDWHYFTDNATGGVRVLSDKIGGSVVEYRLYCFYNTGSSTTYVTTSWLTAGKKTTISISKCRQIKVDLRLADGGTLTPEDITKITLEEETEES